MCQIHTWESCSLTQNFSGSIKPLELSILLPFFKNHLQIKPFPTFTAQLLLLANQLLNGHQGDSIEQGAYTNCIKPCQFKYC